ncbi:VTT domain-containing protein [Patescibacteria group bacterium]|nr:VTT domain-containing protein [Patescibacteria group bacterium]
MFKSFWEKFYKWIQIYFSKILFFVLILLSIVVLTWQIPFDSIKVFILKDPLLGEFIFTLLVVAETLIPPVTILPLVPVAGVIFGPFTTMFYTTLGWTIGSVIAFLISRYLGRPFLKKYISLEKVDQWESKITKKNGFLFLVILRMLIPVDILSYAVGLFSGISFWKYTLASFLGVIPFSFIFSYGYDIFILQNIGVVVISVLVLLILVVSLWFYRKMFRV